MTSPRLRIFIRDPGELATPASVDQLPFFLGTSATGTIAVAKSFGRLQDVEAEYTMGTLVDVAAHFFALGGTTFHCLRLPSSVAGVASAIVQSGAGADLLLTGSAHHHDLSVTVEALTTGDVDLGTQRIRYSLDSWPIENIDKTWSEPVIVPANGTLPIPGTGIILVFNDAEAFVAGEVYTFTTSAPFYTATEVAAATPILQTAAAGDFTYLVYCGDHASSATAANTVGAAIEAQLVALKDKLKPTGAMFGASKDTPTNVLTAFAAASFDPPFGSVGYGGFFAINPKSIQGRGFMRLREHEVAACETMLLAISTDPGWLGNNALTNIVGLDYDLRAQGDALHDARISVGRTWETPVARGVFIARQKLLTQVGSDYVSWQHAAIAIAGLRATIPVNARYILAGLRQTPALTMDPSDIAIVKSDNDRALNDTLLQPTNDRGLPGHVSAASAVVSPTAQLPVVEVTLRIRPFGYPDDVRITTMYAREA